ncbi:hypothetical protein K493DRAFT_110697 [Basidiobolus meristosporus CBS 931.73]|uniref:Uncharacterized protein n=1 Tax=Basidiobolus meristosporus CBS 931.73 TaxID=1314790 RepID=A0A1Y1WQI2_9FUNG|nr:hypothetical protein K493DRAFT_110697 [Basidiobolus meristosporus CBS 931.73]|eukprot:ORX75789.1 hypothetical protein K493DRAFT_110697 [Basidiobolus meristosporus CBS 931.73]
MQFLRHKPRADDTCHPLQSVHTRPTSRVHVIHPVAFPDVVVLVAIIVPSSDKMVVWQTMDDEPDFLQS